MMVNTSSLVILRSCVVIAGVVKTAEKHFTSMPTSVIPLSKTPIAPSVARIMQAVPVIEGIMVIAVKLCTNHSRAYQAKRPLIARTHKCEECGRPATYVAPVQETKEAKAFRELKEQLMYGALR